MTNCCTPSCIDCSQYASSLICEAMKDIMEAACHFGTKFRFYVREEVEVSRDPYKSIKAVDSAGTDLLVPALPVNFSPSRVEIEKAGLKQPVDVMVHTPSGVWLSQGINYKDIDPIRWRVTNAVTPDSIPSEAYRITEVTPEQIINGVPLYWVFGLVED